MGNKNLLAEHRHPLPSHGCLWFEQNRQSSGGAAPSSDLRPCSRPRRERTHCQSVCCVHSRIARGAVLLIIMLAGCGDDPATPEDPQVLSPNPTISDDFCFEDVTEDSGVKFHTVCGGSEKDYVLEVNGCGVALLDYDSDGDLDLFFVNGSRLPPPYGDGPPSPPPSDALYRNLGDMKFEDVTREAGLVESDWGCGVAVGDYNNDGHPDIFVANYGPDRLWKNNGDGTFTDVSLQAGTVDPRWGSSCTFLDYDRDGYLDLFVVNYLEFDPASVKRRGDDPNCQYKGVPILCGPIGLPPAPCTLYRNRQDGTFEDVSDSCGIRDLELRNATYGLGVIALDYDNNGWPDLYVTNDTCRNLLFHNRGDGTFDERGMSVGIAFNEMGIAQAGMGVDSIFMEDREFEDLFVVNYEDDNNTFYRNDGQTDGNIYFTEMTSPMGLASPCFKYLGWGVFFLDVDLDSHLDLFIAQGHVVPQADEIPSSPGYRQPNKLFRWTGDRRYRDVTDDAGPGMLVKKSSRGAACGDLDGDGDLDLVINNIDDRATILENTTPRQGNWLAVKTVGSTSNRDGVGGVVTVSAGGKTWRKRIRSAASYASQSEPYARFGLGPATKVDQLRVLWPTGREETYPVSAVNQMVIVRETRSE